MKRFIAVALAVIVNINTVNIFAADNNYADRQYVISKFIQAVGKKSFSQQTADLNTYKDSVDIDIAYKDDMQIAVANGIVTGYSDNTIRPNNLITRAEAAVMLSRCLGNVEITQGEKHFTDVPQWAIESVNKLTQGGIINGYDDSTFGSSDNITKQQVRIITNKINDKYSTKNLKDNFYEHFNEGFERNYSLKNNAQSYSSFDIVEETVNDRVSDVIENSAYMSDNDSKRIYDVYNLYMDTNTRNSLGIEPLMPYINKIKEMSNVGDIPSTEAYLYKELNISPLFNFNISHNIKNSSVSVVQLGESNTIMSKEHYFNLESNNNTYTQYISYMLNKAGVENADDLSKKVYNFEKTIVQKSGKLTEEDYENVYNRNDIEKYFGGLKIDDFLTELVGNYNGGISLYNSEQITQMSAAVSKENIDVIKAYYIAQIINKYARCLSEDITNAYYTFRSNEYGISQYDAQDRAVSFVKSYAGMALTRKYAAKYYNADKEETVKKMVNTIKENYKTKIENNSWLSDETKKSAVNKLNKIKAKIGYYRGELPYASQINIVSKEQGGSAIDNAISISKVLSRYYLSKPGTSADKSMWDISPLEVNACYVPSDNEIIIPMGIMESPFFDESEEYYVNLASIGSIIAHEISHAFDPMGAMFDENGNYSDWWTKEDKNRFYDLSDKAVKYFGQYEVVNGIDNDGANTLLENVSDLSGLTCIVDIAKKDGADVKIIFETYAKLWNEVCTAQHLENSVKNDPHSVFKIRVNAVLSCIDAFYDAYGIETQDGMYVSPENRISIW